MPARSTWPIRHQIHAAASSSPGGKVGAQRGMAEVTRRAGHDLPRTSGSPVVRQSPPSANLLITISEAASLLGGRSDLPLPIIRVGARMRVPRVAVERILGGELQTGVPASVITLPTAGDVDQHASYCAACGSRLAASSRPTCSAARRSSSTTASV
jgi:hypothetical protein